MNSWGVHEALRMVPGIQHILFQGLCPVIFPFFSFTVGVLLLRLKSGVLPFSWESLSPQMQ